MKLTSILIAASSLTASAFGVNPHAAAAAKRIAAKAPADLLVPDNGLRKQTLPSTTSPLFRNDVTRGGAVPGWQSYNDALDKRPLITKAMTSLVGWALGDLLAQLFIVGGPLDYRRLITLSAFGFLYHGPSGHYFYDWLDEQIVGSDAKSVAIKVLIDQLIWCPIFMIVFFTYLGLVNGDSFSTIQNKIKNDLFTAVQGSWKVWPIVHTINFRFIKTKHRLAFINAVQVAFNMFLSLIGTK